MPKAVSTPTGKQPLDPFATPGEQKPKQLVEYAKVVRDHKGDKIADEQLVRDYLHQQVPLPQPCCCRGWPVLTFSRWLLP